MVKRDRPDAIARAQMPLSARSNPYMPIIVGVVMVVVVLILILLFLFIIPHDAEQGAIKESERVDSAVNESLYEATSDENETIPTQANNISATPDPILSSVEAPFAAEEEKYETEIDS